MNETICVVRCQGGRNAKDRFEYSGPKDCWYNYILFRGSKACEYGCLGDGHCVKVCPLGAIKIGENRLPVVDNNLCNTCGKCVQECPRQVLELIPRAQLVYLACKSLDPEELAKELCKFGCIACRVCVKVCPHSGAIEMTGDLPKMTFEKCTSCGICFNKCPTHSFIDRAKARPYAIISLQCDGCAECVKVCQFAAIEGVSSKRHVVLKDKCVGCGRCFEVCPMKVIIMAGALGYADAA